MIDLLLPAVLVVGIVTLAVTVRNLLSARRSEELGESRYELLRDQRDRLEMLREERRMLVEELERESWERRQLTEYLQETDPRLIENLERRRQARIEIEREAERLEEERRRLEQEHRRSGCPGLGPGGRQPGRGLVRAPKGVSRPLRDVPSAPP